MQQLIKRIHIEFKTVEFLHSAVATTQAKGTYSTYSKWLPFIRPPDDDAYKSSIRSPKDGNWRLKNTSAVSNNRGESQVQHSEKAVKKMNLFAGRIS